MIPILRVTRRQTVPREGMHVHKGASVRTIAVVMFLVASLTAVSAGETVIGFLLPTQQEERWVRDLHVVREKAKEYGARLEVAVARNNQEQQNDQMTQLLDKDVDVMIIAPHDAEAAATAVAAVKEAGVPVISYDRLILGAPIDLYLSFDNVKVGELQGEWLARHAPRGNYVIMSGAPTDANSKMLLDGVMNVLRPLIEKGDITVVAQQPVIDWQPANAMKIVESALAKSNARIDVVVAPNDGTAGGALVALEAKGLGGKVVVTGQDADQQAARRIVRGEQSMTVFKDTRLLGDEAVRAALRLARKEPVFDPGRSDNGRETTVDNGSGEVPAILLKPVTVDRENLEKTLIDSGYMKRESVFR